MGNLPIAISVENHQTSLIPGRAVIQRPSQRELSSSRTVPQRARGHPMRNSSCMQSIQSSHSQFTGDHACMNLTGLSRVHFDCDSSTIAASVRAPGARASRRRMSRPPRDGGRLVFAALCAWGAGSVVALSAEGPLPCGARIWPFSAVSVPDWVNRFCQRWLVVVPGDSCDPVRSFLPGNIPALDLAGRVTKNSRDTTP